MYSSYPINALFNSSATILNSTGINNPGTTTSTIFPVGASSSVYGRPNTLLPFHPSPTQQHQHLYKHQQDQLLLHHQQQQQQQQIQQQQQQQQQIRRLSSDQDANRYVNANLDDFKGHLYELAKDQNGCRFLQRKIEDTSQNNTQAIQAIYDEIHNHFVELMTNSFGNYLCQKLLERCDNQQRDTIVEIVAPDIVNISLNMHGTRAVQKLIEFLSTPEQIQVITSALNPSVVPLIKDLNGNHVIQKCLHRLSAEHRQFIYDAVSDKCVEVATHKHGCCVLQRCIDYASDSQKAQLVEEITRHALPLVQDPYGNYVVQYVLELGDAAFSDGLIRRFIGHTCYLSAQKFSSNVIEKCIRVAEPGTRKLLIAEFIDQTAMEKLLRDSYANYVIQTSLDYTDPNQRTELVECIRPLLASIRSTPYGKRIHGKIYRDQHRSIAQPSQPEQQRSPQSNQGSITL
ncbi:armadillo-type protein [Cunninghamella echinulata]|nr:armadillo-type protein [Cunninghamella echinulata]